MIMIPVEEFISQLNQHEGFSQTEKDSWISRIKQEGLTDTLKEELKQVLQQKIDSEFVDLGIEPDETSEEFKSVQQAMTSEIDAAESEFKKEAKDLKTQAEQLQKDAAMEMDAAMIENARSQIT